MTDLYVDTSALLKRVFIEDGSSEVRDVLRARNATGAVIAASELAWVELARAISRAGIAELHPVLSAACAGIAMQPLNSAVLTRARTIGPRGLRSLDAIHLSAAISLGVTEVLTFDHRRAEAAQLLGLTAIP